MVDRSVVQKRNRPTSRKVNTPEEQTEPAEFTLSDHLESCDRQINDLREENGELRQRITKLELNMDRIFDDWRKYGEDF